MAQMNGEKDLAIGATGQGMGVSGAHKVKPIFAFTEKFHPAFLEHGVCCILLGEGRWQGREVGTGSDPVDNRDGIRTAVLLDKRFRIKKHDVGDAVHDIVIFGITFVC